MSDPGLPDLPDVPDDVPATPNTEPENDEEATGEEDARENRETESPA